MQRRSDPCVGLANWIAHFWCWQMSAGTVMPDLFPGTGGELLFNLGDALQVATISLNAESATDYLFVPKGGAILLRPRKARLTFTAKGNVDILSIRLRSATCFPLLGIALDELDDVPISLADLGLRFPVPALLDLPYEARIMWLEHWLMTLLDRCYLANPAVVWAVNRLYYGDDPSIIRNQLGLTERTMQRRIHQFTGVDARYFCRTARFQRTLRQLLTEGNVLDSAMHHGYCDQSHFIKTCRLYSGLTPTELLTQQYRRLNYYAPPDLFP
ncbi:helix-turn-helix domain-containing protein [Edaphovirga cremea]|uniref:helix-turn-helix domain-containing protein n=1 Tax=Edaphovirga cremea TaxID=2267246 RepID=UPI003989FF38